MKPDDKIQEKKKTTDQKKKDQLDDNYDVF
jgi:hypothetical protein